MKKNQNNALNNKELNVLDNTDRRGFLGQLGKAAIGGATVAAIGAEPFLGSTASQVLAQEGDRKGSIRARQALNIRLDAANANYLATPRNLRHPINGDEDIYPNRIGNFTKGLPHDGFGEVMPSAYNLFMQAVRTGIPANFEAIPLGGDRKLTNPQAGLCFDLECADAHSLVQIPPPAFAGAEQAAEIAENYWMALLRDVPFSEYANNSIAAAAATDLTAFGEFFKGPKNSSGQVTPGLLFRGLYQGDLVGPYLSQFFYQRCFFGANEINQRVNTVMPNINYMTDFSTWLTVQNGVSPSSGLIADPVLRYMRTGRDIGQWVHIDVLFQAYFQAFLVMAGTLGSPLDAGNPYQGSTNQTGFGTFGGPHIGTLVCEVATRALRAVWYQKWIVHRRLRPEAFAARVHQTLNMGRSYPVHPSILNSISSSSRLGGYMPAGNALLPMAFPEGSPTHPAYGAGHATVAGACVTILKAFFDESAIIPNPVMPDTTGTTLVPYTGPALTVGGELNKVASNVALGRNIAGVHWRSDATESLKLGEAIGISVLRDQKATYNEVFNGFSLTKFDGTTITI